MKRTSSSLSLPPFRRLTETCQLDRRQTVGFIRREGYLNEHQRSRPGEAPLDRRWTSDLGSAASCGEGCTDIRLTASAENPSAAKLVATTLDCVSGPFFRLLRVELAHRKHTTRRASVRRSGAARAKLEISSSGAQASTLTQPLSRRRCCWASLRRQTYMSEGLLKAR